MSGKKISAIKIFSIVVLLGLVSNSLYGETVTLTAEMDTYIANDFPDDINGEFNVLTIGDANGWQARIYFELPNVLANTIIDSARLYLYRQDGIPFNSGPNTLTVQLASRLWHESTLTWNTEGSTGRWAYPATNIVIPYSGHESGWLNINVREHVQDWVDLSRDIFGFHLVTDANINEVDEFCSSEETNANLRPMLVINYSTIDLLDDGEAWRSFSPTSGRLGDSFSISTDIRNLGSMESGSFKVQFYLSTNTTISTLDTYVGEKSMSSIPAGGWNNCDWNGVIPSIGDGTYYVGWLIDSANQVYETNENNNRAYKEGYQLTILEPPRVAMPTFSPGNGTYSGTQYVTISCATAGATIRYTTDYTAPTISSTLYTGPVTVSTSLTIQAKAFKSGMLDSYTHVAVYTISPPDRVAMPTFSPGNGTYTSTQYVSISCATAGATIRYTTNGTEPTTSSTIYSSAITVSSSKTLKAKAFKSGMTDSYTATATYTISPPDRVATPTFSPGNGTYTSTQYVSISCATSGATIRYTTNGTEPTTSSTIYSSAITVSSSKTLKAKAFKSGMTDSYTATATYTISPESDTVLYFPQFISGYMGGIRSGTELILMNDCSTAREGLINYYISSSPDEAGTIAYSSHYSIPARGVSVNKWYYSGNLKVGAVEVTQEGDTSCKIEGTEFFKALGSYTTVAPAELRNAQKIYAFKNSSRDTGFAVYNPHDYEININVSFRTDGDELNTSFILGPHSHMAKYLTQLFDSVVPVNKHGTLIFRAESGQTFALMGLFFPDLISNAMVSLPTSPNVYE